MAMNRYIERLGSIYDLFKEYINCEYGDDETCQKLFDFLEKQKILQNNDSFREFLTLINKITKHHRRSPSFFDKIEKIILYLRKNIKKTFNNIELFYIFKRNKRVLLFLIQKKLIIFDNEIINSVNSRDENYSDDFFAYFINELKENISNEKKLLIEKRLLNCNPNIFDDFQKKRLIGENDSYICTLIRQDSIEEFVSYVNRYNISLECQISQSIFETNTYLLYKNPMLIEYAAFFGSIQIFQYLRLNNVYLPPSLWMYVIHSRNPELIHLLEESNIVPKDDTYEDCFTEAIKCHHNDFADYIRYNHLHKFTTNCEIKIIRYYNYQYFKEIILYFFYLYKYKHNKIINLYMKIKRNRFEKYNSKK